MAAGAWSSVYSWTYEYSSIPPTTHTPWWCGAKFNTRKTLHFIYRSGLKPSQDKRNGLLGAYVIFILKAFQLGIKKFIYIYIYIRKSSSMNVIEFRIYHKIWWRHNSGGESEAITRTSIRDLWRTKWQLNCVLRIFTSLTECNSDTIQKLPICG